MFASKLSTSGKVAETCAPNGYGYRLNGPNGDGANATLAACERLGQFGNRGLLGCGLAPAGAVPRQSAKQSVPCPNRSRGTLHFV